MTIEKYCINSQNLPAHELIGLNARVIKSPDANKIGISGRVVYETKNTFEIEVGGKIKKIPKREALMEFGLSGKKLGIISCSEIVCRPEDRIKNYFKKARVHKNG